MEVKFGLRHEVSSMLALDNKIFPKEWHLSEYFVKQILIKNPEIYRVLHDRDKIKGYYCLYPLSQHPYELLLAGNLKETELMDCVLEYLDVKDVYLYFLTLIVDIHDPLRKQYAKILIQDIRKTLSGLEAKGINIIQVGAIAISKDGESILQRIGMFLCDDISVKLGTKAVVYRCKPSELKISVN